MNKWQAVIFDLDDTLYLERDYVFSGFRAVAHWAETNLGIAAKSVYSGLVRLFQAGVRSNTFNAWLEEHAIDDGQYVKPMVEAYRTHSPDIEPFPEVPTLLEQLGKAHKLGLVSDGYLMVQRKKFAALNLEKHFEAIVFSDTWGRDTWKPSRKPFIAVLEGLGSTPPQNAVYVADNPLKDFLGPRQLGMYSIRLRHPEGLHSDDAPPTQMHAPDATILSLLDLEDTLSSLREGSRS